MCDCRADHGRQESAVGIIVHHRPVWGRVVFVPHLASSNNTPLPPPTHTHPKQKPLPLLLGVSGMHGHLNNTTTNAWYIAVHARYTFTHVLCTVPHQRCGWAGPGPPPEPSPAAWPGLILADSPAGQLDRDSSSGTKRGWVWPLRRNGRRSSACTTPGRHPVCMHVRRARP